VNREAVLELCDLLTRGGYGRWLDTERLSVGERLDTQLDAAIDRAALKGIVELHESFFEPLPSGWSGEV